MNLLMLLPLTPRPPLKSAGVCIRGSMIIEAVRTCNLFAHIWRSATGPPIIPNCDDMAKTWKIRRGDPDREIKVGAWRRGFSRHPPKVGCIAILRASHREARHTASATRLKLHQRAWALLLAGMTAVTWTFEPS